jgi:hypothetical protein
MFSGSWVDKYGQAAETMCKNDEGMEGVEQSRRCSKAGDVGKRAGAKKFSAAKVGLVPKTTTPGLYSSS